MTTARPVSLEVPPQPPWARNTLIALFVLYALELFSRNILHLPVDQGIWMPLRGGFAPWQPLTHFLIQGNAVVWVVVSGFVLMLLLPSTADMTARQRAEFFGLTALGGMGLAFILDLFGILHGPALGWSTFVTALIVRFGLLNPNASVLLFFVIPAPASLFVWATGVLSFLGLLAAPSLGTAEYFGAFLGTMFWWRFRGPNAKRHALERKAASIQKELRRFEVIEGGKSRPQSSDDGTVH